MVNKHDWVVDVCVDLEEYARLNGLMELERVLSMAVASAKQTVAQPPAQSRQSQ